MQERENELAEQTNIESSVSTQTAVSEQAPPQYDAAAAKLQELRRRICSGGNWFYWIAGLSLLNTVIALFNSNVSFIAGLGFTQAIDYLIREYGGIAAAIGLLLNLVIAGIYIGLGYCACRRMRWAFIVGMILYSLDTLLFLIAMDLFPLAFHLFALFGIFSGLKADTEARQIEANLQSGGTATY